ncbi:MAG: DUF91 domain-containing protein [Planctomycetes bacterium]|nr:DUF91 domain-containing protein [Planctomycetota bacterium]
MPIRIGIWKVSAKPSPLVESSLASEQLFENMIVAAPHLLSDEWMLIGQQEDTGYGGRIDLLAIAPDGSLVLIELKRDRTPREVVAQALDYASWVEELRAEDIVAIYGRFATGRSLDEDFRQRFGENLDEETLNQGHQIVVVAAELDDSTERIVSYLNERDIPINVLCFQVFANGNEQLLSRAWLLDPIRTQVNTGTSTGSKEPWNGEFYCNYGVSECRSWDDAQKYDFVSAGGGSFYTKTLQLLRSGDRVWVKAPGHGFVGVARVTGSAQTSANFKVMTSSGEVPVLEAAKGGHYFNNSDPEKHEHFVPVHWLQTVPLENAVKEVGLFGNQHSVCKPTTPKWRHTIERLKKKFPNYNNSTTTG